MTRVRRVATVQVRSGSSPGTFPGRGWSQKAPCTTRAEFVQSTEPTHRHNRDPHEIASYFHVVEGFGAPEGDLNLRLPHGTARCGHLSISKVFATEWKKKKLDLR